MQAFRGVSQIKVLKANEAKPPFTKFLVLPGGCEISYSQRGTAIKYKIQTDDALKLLTPVLHGGSSFVNELSQLHISLRQPTAVMRNEGDLNLAVDVKPFRVVIHLLRL